MCSHGGVPCCRRLSHALALLQTTGTTSRAAYSILAPAPGKSLFSSPSHFCARALVFVWIHDKVMLSQLPQSSVAGGLPLSLGENRDTPRISLDASGRRLQGSVTRMFPLPSLSLSARSSCALPAATSCVDCCSLPKPGGTGLALLGLRWLASPRA